MCQDYVILTVKVRGTISYCSHHHLGKIITCITDDLFENSGGINAFNYGFMTVISLSYKLCKVDTLSVLNYIQLEPHLHRRS